MNQEHPQSSNPPATEGTSTSQGTEAPLTPPISEDGPQEAQFDSQPVPPELVDALRGGKQEEIQIGLGERVRQAYSYARTKWTTIKERAVPVIKATSKTAYQAGNILLGSALLAEEHGNVLGFAGRVLGVEAMSDPTKRAELIRKARVAGGALVTASTLGYTPPSPKVA